MNQLRFYSVFCERALFTDPVIRIRYKSIVVRSVTRDNGSCYSRRYHTVTPLQMSWYKLLQRMAGLPPLQWDRNAVLASESCSSIREIDPLTGHAQTGFCDRSPFLTVGANDNLIPVTF
jgi:hypothetical protein